MENFFEKVFSSHVQLNKNCVSKATWEIAGNTEGYFAIAKAHCMPLPFLHGLLCRGSVLPLKTAVH